MSLTLCLSRTGACAWRASPSTYGPCPLVLAEAAETLARLLLHAVVTPGLRATHATLSGDPETLGSGLLRLHLRHVAHLMFDRALPGTYRPVNRGPWRGSGAAKWSGTGPLSGAPARLRLRISFTSLGRGAALSRRRLSGPPRRTPPSGGMRARARSVGATRTRRRGHGLAHVEVELCLWFRAAGARDDARPPEARWRATTLLARQGQRLSLAGPTTPAAMPVRRPVW